MAAGSLRTACLPALLAALLATAGCVGVPKREAAAEPLETRVARYWGLRQAKDLAGLYPFYSSAYRARVPRDEFLKLNRLVRFDLVEYRLSQATPAGAGVDVAVVVRFMAPPVETAIESELRESWVRESDGVWYKLEEPEPLGLFPDTPTP